MTSRQAVAFGQIRSVIAWGIASLLLVTLEACQEKTAYKPPPPPRVTVGTPARQEVTDYLELTGNTQAVNTVQLRARVQGYLEQVFFQDGQVVKKGQPLFQIQRDTYDIYKVEFPRPVSVEAATPAAMGDSLAERGGSHGNQSPVLRQPR